MPASRTRPAPDSPNLLRAAFLTGALADALALIPLVSAPAACFLLGCTDIPAEASLPRGVAASLMAGWTALLLWASGRPAERSFVALLTIGVIAGLVLAEVSAVRRGVVAPERMLPLWGAQALLLILFGVAYGRCLRSPSRRT